MDISSSGNLVASGQVGTKNFKGYAAPVFIWHTTSYRRLQVLKGLTVRVNFVKFSPDERFLCAGGEVSKRDIIMKYLEPNLKIHVGLSDVYLGYCNHRSYILQ